MLGTAGDWAAGCGRQGGGAEKGQRSQEEGGKDPRTGEPLGLTGTWAQVKDVKGGSLDKVRQSQTCARNSLWLPEREGSIYKW